ncbi:Gustatory receptor [Balamuthia mandrillaris]
MASFDWFFFSFILPLSFFIFSFLFFSFFFFKIKISNKHTHTLCHYTFLLLKVYSWSGLLSCILVLLVQASISKIFVMEHNLSLIDRMTSPSQLMESLSIVLSQETGKEGKRRVIESEKEIVHTKQVFLIRANQEPSQSYLFFVSVV